MELRDQRGELEEAMVHKRRQYRCRCGCPMHHEIIFRERSEKGLSMDALESGCRGRVS
ncbi:MAG: hypothetical protein HGA72_09515 [Chlorobiaceae bacterium]|nr:hypothetical protein [Chlorobiaceae bacterium]